MKFFKSLVSGVLETDGALLVDFKKVVAVYIPLDPYRTFVLALSSLLSISFPCPKAEKVIRHMRDSNRIRFMLITNLGFINMLQI